MKKIKIAMLAHNLVVNGVSTVIMNYCSHLNMNLFDVTIMAGEPIEAFYQKKCSQLGIKIIPLNNKRKRATRYYLSLLKAFSEDDFDIVHVHGNSTTIAIELMLAFLNKIRVRIAHSHNITCNHTWLHVILYPFFCAFCTHGFACSVLAGKWMFKKKPFVVINNGFNTEQFKFDINKRKTFRKDFDLEDKFVLGHIGRFNPQKNHPFLLKVFEIVARKNEKAVLLLIGSGPDLESIKSIIEKHPYKNRIILFGETHETEQVYAGIDIFVFPSLFEGLGIVALEAQISGLPCFVSNAVTHDVILGENIDFLPIGDKEAANWANQILNTSISLEARKSFYSNNYDKIARFNISENIKVLEQRYLNMLCDKGLVEDNKIQLIK